MQETPKFQDTQKSEIQKQIEQFSIFNHNQPSTTVITPQQQLKQNQLVAALLKGDFESVKKLESQDTSFLYPNKDNIYPLVAAVYGMNLELVRYIEEKLKETATEQWQKVNIEIFKNKLENQMPTYLTQNTSGELGKWYIKHKNASWCETYDLNALHPICTL